MSDIETLEQSYLRSLDHPINNGDLIVLRNYDALLDALEASFPFCGNTIAWSEVPGTVSVGEFGKRPSRDELRSWFGGAIEAYGLKGMACVVGDGPVELGLVGAIDAIFANIYELADLPQHTYIFSYPGMMWGACISFEGRMYFGFSPKPDAAKLR